jgi:alpha-glucosidase
MYHRSNGVRRGRDGCRVPLPWDASRDSFGFSTGRTSWLPQPDWFTGHAVNRLLGSGDSILHLYRQAIALRSRIPSLSGDFHWLPTEPGVLAFTRGDDFACVVNCTPHWIRTPVDGELLHASSPDVHELLPPDSAAWFLLPSSSEIGEAA